MVLCVMVLCSQRLCAQEMLLGVEEMFRLADRNSVSIKAYGTGREAADEALKAAKSQRLPDINASLSASFLGDGRLWNRDFSGGTGIDIPSFGNNFALEASQVIYAGGAVDSRIELAQIEKQMAELDRYGKLLSRGAVTRQQYDNVHTAFQTAKARYERASRTKESTSLLKSGQSYRLEQCEAAVRLAQAAVDLAGLNLSYTAVVATCDGITGHKDIHEGQLVQPGQTMVEIVDGTDLWVIANYRETQLRNISEGAKVSIKADAVPGIEYEGTVESISDATGAAFSLIPQDNATGNFVKVEQRVPVRIVLDGNPPEALKLLRAGFNVECKVRY